MAQDTENSGTGSTIAATARRHDQKQQKRQRRYGFACSNCRRRKAKCDGEFPTCGKCAATRQDCMYNKHPPAVVVTSLQNQLAKYKERFEQLQHAPLEDRDALIEQPLDLETSSNSLERAPTPQARPHGALERDSASEVSPSASPLFDHSASPDETSLGADGEVCFYGETSLYHIHPQAGHGGQGSTRADKGSAPLSDKEYATEFPGQDTPSNHASAGEATLGHYTHHPDYKLQAFLSQLPLDLLNDLLATYWCWPQHLHCVLSKSIFIRDLYSSGPYASSFLLSAVLAQAARYSVRPDAVEAGKHFATQAAGFLTADIDGGNGNSIATIQGLLIFSARECACGRTSQGWLYSGMAFRMMRDLGIHVAPKKLGYLARHFSPEDLAMRQQVFWSCYTWDKTISLCLGRPPVIHDMIELLKPDTILGGQEANEEVWIPITGEQSPSENLVRQKSWSITRFAAYCELCIIIDNVLDKLYSRPYSPGQDKLFEYLDRTLGRLDAWSERLPHSLSLSHGRQASFCPPIHILLLHLLYHTTVILLCRPFRAASSSSRARCTAAAQSIDGLFTLHVRRFGFRFITYLQTYTMFVACTVNVLDLKDGPSSRVLSPTESVGTNTVNSNRNGTNCNAESKTRDIGTGKFSWTTSAQAADARLDFGLKVLRQAGSTPSAAKCAAIIVKLLNNRLGTGNGNQTTQDQHQEHRAGRLERQSASPSTNGNLSSEVVQRTARTALPSRSTPNLENNLEAAHPITDPNSMESQAPPISRVRLPSYPSPGSNQPDGNMASFYDGNRWTAPNMAGLSPFIPSGGYPASSSAMATENMGGNINEGSDRLVRQDVGPKNQASMINTPWRWLHEHTMPDDWSWMLMDMDIASQSGGVPMDGNFGEYRF